MRKLQLILVYSFLILSSIIKNECRSEEKIQLKASFAEGVIGTKTDWERRVEKVHHDSPADKAGIKKGDLIIDVDGKGKDFPIKRDAGDFVTLKVERRDKKNHREYLTFTVQTVEVSTIKDLEHKYFYGEWTGELK